MAEFWKIFSVFVTAFFGFEKVAVPSAIAMFNFHLLKVIGLTFLGNLTGILVFVNVSAAFLKWWERAKNKYFNTHKHPKVFTKGNRRIIRVKKRFGLWGIAFITPLGITIPVGAFIAERFFKDKKKVVMALSVAFLFWNVTIYFIMMFFYESFKSFF